MIIFIRSLLLLFCVNFCISNNGEAAPVLVLTHAFNKPEFIRWQHATLKKFLKDDYQFIVFNDAPNSLLYSQINEICQNLDILCLDIPQSIHDYQNPYLPGPSPRNILGDPSAECAETIQYMMDTMGFDYPGIVVILDSDMFPIRDLSIKTMMVDYEVATHPQVRKGENVIITYFLPNLLFFNMETLQDKRTLNFNIGIIDGTNVDTAGCTYFYIKDHPGLKWLRTDCVYRLHENASLDNIQYFQSHPKMYQLMTEGKYDFEFYADYTFVHFRGGSNWYNLAAYLDKERYFFDGLTDLLEGPL